MNEERGEEAVKAGEQEREVGEARSVDLGERRVGVLFLAICRKGGGEGGLARDMGLLGRISGSRTGRAEWREGGSRARFWFEVGKGGSWPR